MESRPKFLFLFPALAILCGFIMPIAKIYDYQVFRGVEYVLLAKSGWFSGTSPVFYLPLLIPVFAVLLMFLAGFGASISAVFGLLFSVFNLVLSVLFLFPIYGAYVTEANKAELNLPLPMGDFFHFLGSYVRLGGWFMLAGTLVLLFYSISYLASAGKAELIVNTEGMIYDSVRKNIRQYMMIVALLGIWGIFYVITENGLFLQPRNLSNLFLQSAATAVVAIVVVLVIVTNNIDLSIGSFVGFVGAVAAVAQVDSDMAKGIASALEAVGIPLDFMAVVAILIALLIGVVIGAWHGFWIAYRGVPAFIVTLASMMALRGGILYFTGGKSIYNMYPWFQAIGQEYVSNKTLVGMGEVVLFGRNISTSVVFTILVAVAYVIFELRRRATRIHYGFEVSSVPLQILKLIAACAIIGGFFAIMIWYRGIPYAWMVVLVMMVVVTFIAEKTTFGRHLYAIGGNAEAARLSGINIKRKILYLYILMGVACAISGIIFLARLNAATANAGNGMELDAIASAVIGGTSLLGGEGFIFGGVVGALVMGSLDNGMSLMNIDAQWQYIVKGLVLLFAVWIDIATRKRGN